MSRKIKYLSLFFGLMFCFCSTIYADVLTFDLDGAGVNYNKNGNFSISYDSGDKIKYNNSCVSENGKVPVCWAFCASNGKTLYSNIDYNYSLVSGYQGSKCNYKGVDVSCSRFIGAIIDTVIAEDEGCLLLGKSTTNAKCGNYTPITCKNCRGYMGAIKYEIAQMAIWQFIDDNRNNEKLPSNLRDYFNKTKKVNFNFSYLTYLYKQAYDKATKSSSKTNSSQSTVDISNSIDVSFDDNSKKLYYDPDCTSTDTYKSRNINLYNKSGGALIVTISVDNGNVCSSSSGRCSSSLEVSLESKEFYSFQIKTTNTNNVKLTFSANFNVVTTTTTTSKYVDSEYYHTGQSNIQDMIIRTKEDSTTTSTTTSSVKDSISYNLTADIVEHVSCGTPSESTKSGYCANLSNNKEDYIKTFNGCGCETFDIDGKKVSVLITEDVKFRFGNLVPGVTYPGGGYRFAEKVTSDKTDGVTTEYLSRISWKYKDTINSIGYYYDPVTRTGGEVNGDITEKINNIIRERLKSDTLDLSFSTYVDDDKTKKDFNTKEVNLNVPVNISEDFENKTINISTGIIKLNRACFNKEGKVIYSDSDDCNNDDYNIDGGNALYIPLDYSKSKYKPENDSFDVDDKEFPFYINKSNLSIYDGDDIDFYYSAQCSVNLETVFSEKELKSIYSIRFRPIDINNPFPKGISNNSNWYSWWFNNPYDLNDDGIVNANDALKILKDANTLNDEQLKLEATKKALIILKEAVGLNDKDNWVVDINNQNRIKNSFDKLNYSIIFANGTNWNINDDYNSWKNIDKETGASSFIQNKGFKIYNVNYCPIGKLKKNGEICD